MRKINKLTILNISLLISCNITAAPVIDTMQGTIENGNAVVLVGSNFSSAKAAPLVWDTVDNHNNLIIENNSTVPEGEIWTDNGSAWTTPILFDTNNNRGGRKASYAGKTKSYLRWPKAIENEGLNSLYVSWWFWPSEDPADAGGANKFIRIWDESDGDHTRISWTSVLLGHGSKHVRGAASWADWGGVNGQWNRLEIWVSEDKKEIKAWVNNKLVHNLNDFVKSNTTKGLNVYLMGFDPSVSSNYPDFTFNLSDIYMSASIARVEISDKEEWSDLSATREIQHVNVWGDKNIEFTVNFGSFRELSNKYLYVVDADGNVNQKGYSLCPKCPTSPMLGIE